MVDQTRRYSDQKRDSRSKSPSKEVRPAHRTRSPHRHHHRRKRSPVKPEVPKELPYGARPLIKRDFTVFKPMFASYLDIQKQKFIEDLDEVETKGRWKSFVGRWNRGELAEGWYDPSTLQKAIASSSEPHVPARAVRSEDPLGGAPATKDGGGIRERSRKSSSISHSGSESDDSVGPTLPGKEGGHRRSRTGRMGPRIPTSDDLQLKREADHEQHLAHREDLRHRRTTERQAQKEALDELVPRAEPGSFERRVEKRAAATATMRDFRDRRSPSAAEVPDAELMGSGGGGSGGGADGAAADFRREKQEFERKKNEREVRKEEILRARAAEREERLAEYQAKEDKTMAMLKELAKQRFGGGS